MAYFSQHDEEPHILRLLADCPVRRFLDIGAHDGTTNSNTRALALAGWQGTFVEPSPWSVANLLDLYGRDESMRVIQAVLSCDDRRLSEFWECGVGQLGTTRFGHACNRKPEAERTGGYRFMLAGSVEWRDILDTMPIMPSFISLDVEGCNMQTLAVAPWGRLDSVRVICVEKDHQSERDYMLALLEERGFRLAYESGENLLGVRA